MVLDAPFAQRIGDSYDFLDSSPVSANVTQERLSQSFPGVPLRHALPLWVPGPRGQLAKKTPVVELKRSLPGPGQNNSITSESRAWLVAPSTVYLHPEHLAPPEEIIANHRQFEFGAVNPHYIGKKYRQFSVNNLNN